MAKIELNQALNNLLGKWDDDNPNDLESYRKIYGESLIKWLYDNNYIIVLKQRRDDL